MIQQVRPAETDPTGSPADSPNCVLMAPWGGVHHVNNSGTLIHITNHSVGIDYTQMAFKDSNLEADRRAFCLLAVKS